VVATANTDCISRHQLRGLIQINNRTANKFIL
jgi:hypothetical protein